MTRALACGLLFALVGCASGPDLTALCGTWAREDMRERWELDGRDLRGEGRSLDDGVELVTETLALRRTRGGHVYVATPGDAAPTEFAPIDPHTARFGPSPSADDPGVRRWSWANYAHDFPQEIHYLLAGDRLTASIGGPERQLAWEFHRVAGCTTKHP